MPDLPSFERPPVKEVVIAARFKRANRYSILALGEIAQQMEAAGFSKIEEQPSYEAPAEEFGPTNEQNGMSLRLLPGSGPDSLLVLKRRRRRTSPSSVQLVRSELEENRSFGGVQALEAPLGRFPTLVDGRIRGHFRGRIGLRPSGGDLHQPH